MHQMSSSPRKATDMKLEALKNIVTSGAGRQLLQLQKHSPTIMIVAGAVGVVSTAVLAARATLKLEDILVEAQKDLKTIDEIGGSFSDEDKLQAKSWVYARAGMGIAKLYGPTFVVGVATISCMVGSHSIMTKRNAGLAAAYKALDEGFKKYRARVAADLGEDKDLEYRYGLKDTEIVDEDEHGQKVTVAKRATSEAPSIYARFFDETNRNWVRNVDNNRMFLRAQQNWANDKLQARGHLFLNEVYEMLGMEHTKPGAVCGWVFNRGDGDKFVDFGIFNGDSVAAREFVNGHNYSILLDFNVDGPILDLI